MGEIVVVRAQAIRIRNTYTLRDFGGMGDQDLHHSLPGVPTKGGYGINPNECFQQTAP